MPKFCPRPTTSICLAGLLLLLASLVLAGCQSVTPAPPRNAPTASVEVDVPFETIEQTEDGSVNESVPPITNAQLLLLTSPDELGAIEGRVRPEAMLQLRQIDFQQYAVVALFRGVRPGGNCYQTAIEHITVEDSRLFVYAQFWSPSPRSVCTANITYPYHLVKVEKRRLPVAWYMDLVLQVYPLTPTPPPDVAAMKLDVPFETLALDQMGVVTATATLTQGAQLMLLTSPAQLEDIAGMVRPEALAALEQIDYSREAVVALFRGSQPPSDYHIAIDHITSWVDRLEVDAEYWAPGIHGDAASEPTAPYHLVKVPSEMLSSAPQEIVLQWFAGTPMPPGQ